MKALGDYCGGVPPLTIPNREVKTASADGTAFTCGRVGRRQSLKNSVPFFRLRSFFCSILNRKDYPGELTQIPFERFGIYDLEFMHSTAE